MRVVAFKTVRSETPYPRGNGVNGAVFNPLLHDFFQMNAENLSSTDRLNCPKES